MEQEKETLKHLFQIEFAKMVAVISNLFGLEHIETAEDIVSQTFLLALETWSIKGIPANPTAWLYLVAKQKTIKHFNRNKLFEKKIRPQLTTDLKSNDEMAELDFSLQNIKDSQLQMLFAVCNPAIASESQIGLALRILCGFGIDEIADAFLSNKETINKRLLRAKDKLRTAGVKMELPPENEIDSRLDNVLHIIYLLFNEGYYSQTQNNVLRKDLCLDAMRLAVMLTEYNRTNRPDTNALLALMCFHASRFDARQTSDDALVLYEEQNKELWDEDLIKQGIQFLELSASGKQVSSYHIEARIAYWHCMKEETPESWEKILQLYNLLLRVNNSPGVALNRIFALYKAKGHQEALKEAEKLNVADSHFYFMLLGELHLQSGSSQAKHYFQKAFTLAQTEAEKKAITKKIDGLIKK